MTWITWRTLRPLAALADETGAAFLLLHHEGKSARTNVMHVGVGSIGIMAAARSALFCGKHPDDESRFVMVHAKSSEEEKAQSVAYKLARHELDNGAASVRLELDGVTDVDALAVVNGPTHQGDSDRGALDEAVEFLETYLSNGPATKADVLKAARREGISTSGALRRAVDALGVESKPLPQDGTPRNRWPWAWNLPGAPRVAQPPLGGYMHNPAQPNADRIETGTSRVVQGCASEVAGSDAQPVADACQHPPGYRYKDTFCTLCKTTVADPTAPRCKHTNKRRTGDAIRGLWICLDCGETKGDGRSGWRACTHDPELADLLNDDLEGTDAPTILVYRCRKCGATKTGDDPLTTWQRVFVNFDGVHVANYDAAIG